MDTKESKDLSVAEKSTRTYTLKHPITHRGKPKNPGDKVDLRQDQADRLKQSGHI